MFLENELEYYVNNLHSVSIEPLNKIDSYELTRDIIDYTEELYPKLTLNLNDFNVVLRETKNNSKLVIICFDSLKEKCQLHYPELTI